MPESAMVKNMDKLIDAKELIKKIELEMYSTALEGSDKRFMSIPLSTILELCKGLERTTLNAWIPARNSYIEGLLHDLIKED
jgi:DNA-binding Xre family transcriptional regulator